MLSFGLLPRRRAELIPVGTPDCPEAVGTPKPPPSTGGPDFVTPKVGVGRRARRKGFVVKGQQGANEDPFVCSSSSPDNDDADDDADDDGGDDNPDTHDHGPGPSDDPGHRLTAGQSDGTPLSQSESVLAANVESDVGESSTEPTEANASIGSREPTVREDRVGQAITAENAQALLPPSACVFVAK